MTNNVVTDFSALSDGDGFRALLSDIDPLPRGNVRKSRDPQEFADLRASIKASKGVTQGVTVRLNPDDPTRLQLIAGYGRVEASRLEGFDTVPAVFKVADDKTALEMMLSENSKRAALPIADEVVAAQDYASFYNGDDELAAKHLGWSVKKYRGRLLLNRCTDEVLEALRANLIGVGHAEILSVYTPKIQNGTLSRIVAEGWSLDLLKERAGAATQRLKHAFFDTSGCSGCPHNSDLQATIFDNTVGMAKCSNLVCFKEKTDSALEESKSRLSESYELVLLEIEKPSKDRNTVSVSVVGKEQFENGCTGCANNSVILKGGINSDAGDLIENQCVDTDCFRKMVAAKSAADTPKKATKKKPGKKASKKSTPVKKKSNISQKTPAGVVAQNKGLLHKLSADHFSKNTHFREALTVASLAAKVSGGDLQSLKGLWVAPTAFQAKVLSLYKLEKKELAKVKQAVFSLFIAAPDLSEASSLMIEVLSQCEEKEDVAVSGWKPTEEILKPYLSGSLINIAKKSGFVVYYDSVHGKGAFAKVSKRKSDVLQALLKTEFDWSLYAPADYLKLLSQK